MMKMRDIDWTPVRSTVGGKDFFCSPRCGCGCTMADYNKAVSTSSKAARKMGRGWKPEVWENMGWHWCIVKGVAKIHPGATGMKRGGYTAYINSAHQTLGRGSTPAKALAAGIAEASQRARKVLADCELVR